MYIASSIRCAVTLHRSCAWQRSCAPFLCVSLRDDARGPVEAKVLRMSSRLDASSHPQNLIAATYEVLDPFLQIKRSRWITGF